MPAGLASSIWRGALPPRCYAKTGLMAANPAAAASRATGWGRTAIPISASLQPDALAGETNERGEAGDAAPEAKEGGKKASQQITIDQVRALDDFLHVGTHRSGLRVVIVNPAEAMKPQHRQRAPEDTRGAGGPAPVPARQQRPERLLPTIRSRCQTVAVPLPPPDRATHWLAAAGVADAARWLALSGSARCWPPSWAVPAGQLIDAARTIAPWTDAGCAGCRGRARKDGEGGEGRYTPMKRLMEWAQKWLVDLAGGLAAAGTLLRLGT